MKITAAESFVLKVPVGNAIADSMQFVTHLEFAGLTIATDAGISGTGYTMTVGHGGRVIQEALDSLFIDDLLGKDPRNVREIWQQLYFGKSHWIGRAGATTMAQSAIDIALWDINAKAAELPLWQLLGGAREADIPIYNTHAGWLNYSIDQLTDEALKLLGQGYTALKMKVGRADSREDRRPRGRRAQGDRRRRAPDGRCEPEMGPDAGLPRGAPAGGIRSVVAGGTAAPRRHPFASDPQRGHRHSHRARRACLHDACVSRLHRRHAPST